MQENTNTQNPTTKSTLTPKDLKEAQLREMKNLLHPEYVMVYEEVRGLLNVGTDVDGKGYKNHPFSKENWLKYILTLQEVDAIAASGQRFVNGYAVADFGFLAIFKPLVKPAPFVFSKLTNQVDFIKRHTPQGEALKHILTPVELTKLNKQLLSITGRAQWETWKNSETFSLEGDVHRVKYSDFQDVLMHASLDNKVAELSVPAWFEVRDYINLRELDNGKWFDMKNVILQHFAK